MIARQRTLCTCLFQIYFCYRVDQYTNVDTTYILMYVGHPSIRAHTWQVQIVMVTISDRCVTCAVAASLSCLKWLINVRLRKRAGRWRASRLHAAWLLPGYSARLRVCVCPLPRVVKEEISDDNAKLPCFNGRVVSWVSEMDATLLHGS